MRNGTGPKLFATVLVLFPDGTFVFGPSRTKESNRLSDFRPERVSAEISWLSLLFASQLFFLSALCVCVLFPRREQKLQAEHVALSSQFTPSVLTDSNSKHAVGAAD